MNKTLLGVAGMLAVSGAVAMPSAAVVADPDRQSKPKPKSRARTASRVSGVYYRDRERSRHKRQQVIRKYREKYIADGIGRKKASRLARQNYWLGWRGRS